MPKRKKRNTNWHNTYRRQKRRERYGLLKRKNPKSSSGLPMSTADWEASWKAGLTGFHSKALHPMLEKHASKILDGQENCKVFVPLCGKSVDMKWLADQGHNVVGVDVVRMALTNFFKEQGIVYFKESVPKLPGAIVYKSKDGKITLYNADIFSMTSDIIGKFDCIWDRASLVALGKADREKYAPTLTSLMGPNCRYLLSVVDYDSSKTTGPPYNVPNSEVTTLYESSCEIEKIDTSFYPPSESGEDAECVQTLFLMKPKYTLPMSTDWEANWKAGKIGFHFKAIHPMLEKHASKILDGQENCKVFVPLCGKSVDMKWFADQGHYVVGVEVVEMAITSFYEEQGIEYVKESVPKLPGATVYKSKDGKIALYNADIFTMTSDIIGEFDCIWDRASLVALNKTDREKYAPTLTSLMGPNCRYLLSVYDYDPSKATGPPYNVPNSEVTTLYESSCNLEEIDTSFYHPSKFAVDVECVQTLFLMKPK